MREPWNIVRECRRGYFIANRNDQYVGRALIQCGEFSEGEVEEWSKLLTPDMILIEVGANIGALTVPLSRMCKQVIAIEPQFHCYLNLCGNLALNSIENVTPLNLAAGSKAGHVTMAAHDPAKPHNFGGVSMMEAIDGPAKTVAMIRLDDLGIKADALKIDVEGMELDVLTGAENLIKATRPIIQIEVDRPWSGKAVEWLQERNYQITRSEPLLVRQEGIEGLSGIVSLNAICQPIEKLIASDNPQPNVMA